MPNLNLCSANHTVLHTAAAAADKEPVLEFFKFFKKKKKHKISRSFLFRHNSDCLILVTKIYQFLVGINTIIKKKKKRGVFKLRNPSLKAFEQKAATKFQALQSWIFSLNLFAMRKHYQACCRGCCHSCCLLKPLHSQNQHLTHPPRQIPCLLSHHCAKPAHFGVIAPPPALEKCATILKLLPTS